MLSLVFIRQQHAKLRKYTAAESREDGCDKVRVEGPQSYIDIYIGRESFARLLYKTMVDHEDLRGGREWLRV